MLKSTIRQFSVFYAILRNQIPIIFYNHILSNKILLSIILLLLLKLLYFYQYKISYRQGTVATTRCMVYGYLYFARMGRIMLFFKLGSVNYFFFN